MMGSGHYGQSDRVHIDPADQCAEEDLRKLGVAHACEK